MSGATEPGTNVQKSTAALRSSKMSVQQLAAENAGNPSSRLPLIDIDGDARARGRSHGEQLRGPLHDFYDAWVDFICRTMDTNEADLVSYAASHLPASRAYAPELVEEVAGIAEAGNLGLEQVFLLNCFDEVSCHGPGQLVSGLHHCTAFAASGPATPDGKTLVGQAWDADRRVYPMYLMRLSTGGHAEALVVSNPGIVGGTGINIHGLGIVWNTLKASDYGVGVPAPLVVRKALQAQFLSQLIKNVINSRRANGMNFIAGSTDQAVNIELTATKYRIRYCYNVLGHANHYEEPDLLDFELDLPMTDVSTLLRTHRMRQLLEERAGSITVPVAQEVLTDHTGKPASICRHEENMESLTSVVYDLSSRKIWATNGNPCTAPFVEYPLN
jgi:isopenicillin-N N-acyltransferase-like protein